MKKIAFVVFCIFTFGIELCNAKNVITVVTPSAKQAKIQLPKIKPVPFKVPEIQKVTTDIGVEAWLIEEKSTPVIAMNVLFKGGSASDSKRLKGLSDLTMSLMDEGAGRYNARQWVELLSENGIGISFGASKNVLSADLQTLRDNKEQAFDLFHTALTKPRFNHSAIKRMKNQMYAGIDAEKGNPNAIAGKRWAKLVYKNHVYSDLSPTKKSVRSITRANLRKLISSRFAKDNIIIGVAGNISATELKPLLEKTFKDLPETSYAKPVPVFTPNLTNRTDVLSMNIPQSVVLFGHQGINRHDKDYYAAVLVNYILGGGNLSSRLFDEVREKKGLAYSVSTGLSTDKNSPMITGAVGSDNAKLSQAISIIREQWQKMADNGPSVQELKDAKTFLTGAFPLAFSSSSGLASFLTAVQFNNLGIDYFQNYNDLINSVTVSQAKQTAKKLLKPENLFFVVVGKPANL